MTTVLSSRDSTREFAFEKADFHKVQNMLFKKAGIKLSDAKEAMVYSRLALQDAFLCGHIGFSYSKNADSGAFRQMAEMVEPHSSPHIQYWDPRSIVQILSFASTAYADRYSKAHRSPFGSEMVLYPLENSPR